MVGKRMGPTGGFRQTLVLRTQQAAMADSGASRGADGDGKQGQSESGSGSTSKRSGEGYWDGSAKDKGSGLAGLRSKPSTKQCGSRCARLHFS